MEKVEVTILIARSPEDVFAFIINDENDALWQAGVLEADITSGGPFGVGSKFMEVFNFLGRRIDLSFEVTEFDPVCRFAFRSISGPIPIEGGYILEPVAAGTRVTFHFTAEAGRFFKFSEPVVARIAQKEWESNMAKLKTLLEKEA